MKTTPLLFLLVLAALLVPGCSRSSQPPAELVGEWIYASAETEGKTTHASGSLILAADGTFDESRYIGSIGGFRKGTYTVSGDKLTFTDTTSKQDQSFAYRIQPVKDAAGKVFPTLLLQGSSLSYLLSKKE